MRSRGLPEAAAKHRDALAVPLLAVELADLPAPHRRVHGALVALEAPPILGVNLRKHGERVSVTSTP